MKFTVNNTVPLKDNFIYMHTRAFSKKPFSTEVPGEQ